MISATSAIRPVTNLAGARFIVSSRFLSSMQVMEQVNYEVTESDLEVIQINRHDQYDLETTRRRLRQRFHEKFSADSPLSENSVMIQMKSSALADNKKDSALEAARLRIRNRFHQKFKAAPLPTKIQAMQTTNVINDDGNEVLDAARFGIRKRFQLKFHPDFCSFPDTVDAAVDDMFNSPWGLSNAVVLTEANPPYRILRVNKCWEELCGFTQDEICGATFQSLGIQGSFTEPQTINHLRKKLQRKEHVAVQLTNVTKDGESFRNYLRVAPLKTSEFDAVTHFIGVLQNQDTQLMQQAM